MQALAAHLTALALTAASAAPQSSARAVPTPSEHLGRPAGGDFTLADWEEVSSFYAKLAAASPNVRLETVGTTTEGRPFELAVFGSAANLARLGELEARAARIADPRGLTAQECEGLIDSAVPSLFISLAMHSTECAGAQFGMELAHRLATSNEEPYRSARASMLVYMPPCLNPDGVDHVTHWYRSIVGTPYEDAGLTELYQRYAGHDNNRDWFGLALAESRIVTGLLYSRIFPQVYWDVHQQGSMRERFFVPPFRDPLNPALAPEIVTAIDALGSRVLFDMTRAGFTGISTGVSYDMWWNGGNRNVPVRHNIVGLLTEAASANLASPRWLPLEELSPPRGVTAYAPSHRFPVPWPGGWWRISDIIEYELAFAESLLGSLTRERDLWLSNALEASLATASLGLSGAPSAYIVPADAPNVGAVERLVDGLLLGGVEVYVADSTLAADGRTWPAGSVVLPLGQPYGRHVRDLFQRQAYPEGEPPYDVAGWTLPLLFGLETVEVHGALAGELRRVRDVPAAVAGLAHVSRPSLFDRRAWQGLVDALVAGSAAAVEPFAPARGGEASYGHVAAGERGRLERFVEAGEGDFAVASRMPRVGVVAPWSGVMSEGWLRWFLDSYSLPYERVRPETIRGGRLREVFDVLIAADISARTLEEGRLPGTVAAPFARGLGDDGALALRAFVREGGTLIAMQGSAEWAAALFDVPVVDVTKDAEGFSCPGSVLRTELDRAAEDVHLSAPPPVMFADSAAWKVDESHARASEVRVVLRYAADRLLLSGYVAKPETIAGQAAWVTTREGEGALHLFAFEPQYRGWSEAAFQLLLRAALLER